VLFASAEYAELNAVLNQLIDIKTIRRDLALQKTGLLLESQQRFDEAIATYRDALLNCYSIEGINEIENAIQRCNIKKKYA